ncbi:MAG: FAD-dependent 5-carboxymethylaminomethyl-2-thiouridine(34) oxidoreductase MnmC [Acidobacteria bacterium]|nr:FAD-dependent 5-carboxymethylaminomethyl-2-thiouridine(34) oxidoreductase MnmC [Acidobacteriota bacterium]
MNVVVGGGLAGCSIAYALAEAGADVLLIEQRGGVGQAASGNPQGILMPYLSDRDSGASSVYGKGFEISCQILDELADQHGFALSRGVAQLPTNRRLTRVAVECTEMGLWLGAQDLSEHTGIALSEGGFWFPNGRCVQVASLCDALANHHRIRRECDLRVNKIERLDGSWRLETTDTPITAMNVFVAASYECAQLDQLNWLPQSRVRGQIAYVRATPKTKALKAAICADGYVTPAHCGFHVAGATFDRDIEDEELRPERNRELLRQIGTWAAPFGAPSIDCDQGRVAFRHTTPDRLPIVGMVPRMETWLAGGERAVARFNRDQVDYWPNLYVSAGHGSRGLTTCFAAARHLVGLVQGLLQVDRTLEPLRFARQAMIRSLKQHEATTS